MHETRGEVSDRAENELKIPAPDSVAPGLFPYNAEGDGGWTSHCLGFHRITWDAEYGKTQVPSSLSHEVGAVVLGSLQACHY